MLYSRHINKSFKCTRPEIQVQERLGHGSRETPAQVCWAETWRTPTSEHGARARPRSGHSGFWASTTTEASMAQYGWQKQMACPGREEACSLLNHCWPFLRQRGLQSKYLSAVGPFEFVKDSLVCCLIPTRAGTAQDYHHFTDTDTGALGIFTRESWAPGLCVPVFRFMHVPLLWAASVLPSLCS